MRQLPTSALILAATLSPLAAIADEVCLLEDPNFRRGADVYDPQEGIGHRKIGTLEGARDAKPPSWGISQWNTHSPFSGVPKGSLADPEVIRYSMGSKEVVFGRSPSAAAELVLRLNAAEEYPTGTRPANARWPALFVWERLDDGPSLAKARSIDFRMEVKLDFSRNLQPAKTFDPRQHAAQFTVFLTLQNVNRQSSDFGRYVWFGLPIYDSRHDFSPAHEQMDQATRKPIYLVASRQFTQDRVNAGQWSRIEADLIDEARKAVNRAIATRAMPDTRLEDVFIRGINIGWEMPGAFDARMQLRKLKLCMN